MPTSPLLAAAQAVAGAQQYPAGTLYVVATPIGNLADLSLRAIHVLSLVDAVACEDTRVSAALLRHLGLGKPMLAVHEHNERDAARSVVTRLAEGQRVAYVSDAGTPAVSDPGAALVAAVQAAGYRCMPIPGASAPMTALSVAGDAALTSVCFLGFAPPKGAARDAALREMSAAKATQILFEAPHRIVALAHSLGQLCGARRITLCRELTKQFETVATMGCNELPAWLAADANRERGEFVLVLHALSNAPAVDVLAGERELQILLRDLPLKQAVALAAEITGAQRNALYERALASKRQGGD